MDVLQISPTTICSNRDRAHSVNHKQHSSKYYDSDNESNVIAFKIIIPISSFSPLSSLAQALIVLSIRDDNFQLGFYESKGTEWEWGCSTRVCSEVENCKLLCVVFPLLQEVNRGSLWRWMKTNSTGTVLWNLTFNDLIFRALCVEPLKVLFQSVISKNLEIFNWTGTFDKQEGRCDLSVALIGENHAETWREQYQTQLSEIKRSIGSKS